MFGQCNKNGKGTIYAHPPLFIPSFFVVEILTTQESIAKLTSSWPYLHNKEINLLDHEILCRNFLPLLS